MAKKQKNVVLKAHHRKAYRKRHLGLLILLILGFVMLSAAIIQYRDDVMIGATSSRDYLVQLVTGGDSSKVADVESSYGFSMKYDTSNFYASAIDGKSGKVYQAGATKEVLPYTAVQVSPYESSKVKDRSAFNIYYHPELSSKKTLEEAQILALRDAGIRLDSVALVSQGKTKIGGKDFDYAVWQTAAASDGLFAALKVSFSVYTANLNSHPFSVVIAEGFVSNPGTHPQYDDILNSISFDSKLSALINVNGSLASTYKLPTLADTLFTGSMASAATAVPDVDNSAKISALYGPSVVKIYNVECQDIEINGIDVFSSLYFDTAGPCMATTGSGFIVSQDGYVATNGHVGAVDPRNFTASLLLSEIVAGYSDSLVKVITATKLTNDDVKGKDSTAVLDAIYDAIYNLKDSEIKAKNPGINLLVSLDDKVPSKDDLKESTTKREDIKTTSGLKKAEVKAYDFRYSFGKATKYKDVAILKIDGSNYPLSRLGSQSEVTQGDTINIMGFPGNASSNGVVDDSTSTSTLTAGKVTAIKNTSDNNGKMIESNATVSHGNSGGPAYSDAGNVVGITTYSVSAKQEGDANFAYIRDIKDLTDLASKKHITFDTNSTTQENWEKGMGYFYTAHYSKALPYFDKVKESYPNHNKVAEMTATAKTRIDQGLDVKDFPVIPVAIGAVVLLLAIGGVVIVIVRQSKKHKVYQAGVAQGTVNPMARGAAPQTVAVNPQVQQVNGNIVQDQAQATPQVPPVYTTVQPDVPQQTPEVNPQAPTDNTTNKPN